MRLLTVADVALALRVTPKTVYRLLAAGKLPRVKVGAAVRVRPEDLDRFIDRQTQTGGAA